MVIDLLIRKKALFVSYVKKTAEVLHLDFVPIVIFWKTPCPNYEGREWAHIHVDIAQICVNEKELIKMSDDRIKEVANHEVSHMKNQDHSSSFHQTNMISSIGTWSPGPGIVRIGGNSDKLENIKETLFKEDKIRCNYHLCREKTEVSKCFYCERYFCKNHIKPLPPRMKNFDNSSAYEKILDNEYNEEKHHPCSEYAVYLIQEEKRKRKTEAEALNRLLKGKKNIKFESENEVSIKKKYCEICGKEVFNNQNYCKFCKKYYCNSHIDLINHYKYCTKNIRESIEQDIEDKKENRTKDTNKNTEDKKEIKIKTSNKKINQKCILCGEKINIGTNICPFCKNPLCDSHIDLIKHYTHCLPHIREGIEKELKKQEKSSKFNYIGLILIVLILLSLGFFSYLWFNNPHQSTHMNMTQIIIENNTIEKNVTVELISFDKYLDSEEYIGKNIKIEGYLMLKKRDESNIYDTIIYDDFNNYIYLDRVKVEPYKYFERDIKTEDVYVIEGKLFDLNNERRIVVSLVEKKNV